MNKKHILLFILAIFVTSGFGCQKSNIQKKYQQDSLVLKQEERLMIQEGDINTDKNKITLDQEFLEKMRDISQYQYAGPLLDISGSKASGVAQSTFQNDTFVFISTFRGLEEPPQDHYYQGWIIKKPSLEIISTGRVEKNKGIYTNMYSSQNDLTDYRIYILTLEKENGDQKPETHILEGTLKPIKDVMQ